MSWLLFLDESGHDHRSMPYEVRGGIAIKDRELWGFVQDMKRLERESFGIELPLVGVEVKGSKLLDRDRFKWASQAAPMPIELRQQHCRAFLTKGLEKKVPSRDEFTAFGQACLEMARRLFQLMGSRQIQIFAAVIPRGLQAPDGYEVRGFLRKDFVSLFERYFDLLDREQELGLIVIDEVEHNADRRFVRRLEDYFTKTRLGQLRTEWIVPIPLFVSSLMTYPVQAADVAIYCVNWGFRIPNQGMDAEVRSEIAEEFGALLGQLQYQVLTPTGNNASRDFGIVFVPDPYSPT